MHDGIKEAVQRPAEAKLYAKLGLLTIENEEEEEGWREGDQMAAQWDEEQKLEEILQR